MLVNISLQKRRGDNINTCLAIFKFTSVENYIICKQWVYLGVYCVFKNSGINIFISLK